MLERIAKDSGIKTPRHEELTEWIASARERGFRKGLEVVKRRGRADHRFRDLKGYYYLNSAQITVWGRMVDSKILVGMKSQTGETCIKARSTSERY